jgi:hypothetical protein
MDVQSDFSYVPDRIKSASTVHKTREEVTTRAAPFGSYSVRTLPEFLLEIPSRPFKPSACVFIYLTNLAIDVRPTTYADVRRLKWSL